MADTDHIAAIDAYFRRSSEALSNAAANPLVRAAIQEISAVVAKAFSAGRKLMLAGNGGSAADAQHIAAEFLSRLHHGSQAAACDRADNRHVGAHSGR